ncbi:DNA-binding protein [Chakrabartyella piscis]|uniref:DNA-binding protein n=1 Tax=Chakrabartyella piscis TaxID=2918914 RepID=UPI002958DDC6|nr:DNA-binding protein [Chakrabartyella piscis]
MSKVTLLTATDVAEILGMSKPYCYKVIAKMNEQLEKEGYMTIRGKISKTYFEEKYYGLQTKTNY